MMNNKVFEITLVFFLFFISNVANAQTVPFNTDQWTIDARGVVFDSYKGETDVLFMYRGKAMLKDVAFQNGIIEFDIFMTERRSFPSILFRMEDDQNHEEFYLRAHRSGFPDAMQYSPVYGGLSAWQLYHDQAGAIRDGNISWALKDNQGYNTTYDYSFDRWLHIKLVVSGKRADLYFDHEDKPILQIRDLKRGVQTGFLGLKSSLGAMHFANFSYTAMDNPPMAVLEPSNAVIPPHLITQWHVSTPFKESQLKDVYQLNDSFLTQQKWTILKSEASGITNLAQLTSKRDKVLNTAFAQAIIQSDNDQIKRLDIGYSDRVKVFLNGQLLYGGNNTFRAHDFRSLGTIGFLDAVYLPLKKGENQLIIAVSETFGGWGLEAKFGDMDGINVKN